MSLKLSKLCKRRKGVLLFFVMGSTMGASASTKGSVQSIYVNIWAQTCLMWLMDGSWYKVVEIEENQPNHPVEF